ncbi:hypothetical protein LEP1GSC060_2587 [Leptospira weilii serovar Ranarum str. ICFT]|uniref:Uncharacterized protein n=1 Tax=Leptospira weilii serovar Ranarum str. ICFT TaxID=1218598 RepID=N1WQ21_9LEPT|nr:hypothetical protein LEP1GSC060_2587 [Leptospira weilii serovar Ranarum str. ICFT]
MITYRLNPAIRIGILKMKYDKKESVKFRAGASRPQADGRAASGSRIPARSSSATKTTPSHH